MKRIILFDFDGVIVDTFEMAFAFHPQMGIKMSRRGYRDIFMGNIYHHFSSALTNHDPDVHHKKWFDLYTAAVVDVLPIAGMSDVIKKLAKEYTLAIVSSSETYSINAYLLAHNLTGYFEKIYGADVHRSKVEKINRIMREYGITPRECVFITDTAGDVFEAHECGVSSIAVSWGFHSQARLRSAKPWAFVRTPGSLLKKIDSYFNSGSVK